MKYDLNTNEGMAMMMEECQRANAEADRLERAKHSGLTYEDAINLIDAYMRRCDEAAMAIEEHIAPRRQAGFMAVWQ